MNERLQRFLAAENISQSQFADTIGVARASISHILAGRNKPGFDFLESMARNYPDLNLEWLLTGQGRMYRRENDAQTPEYGGLFDSQGLDTAGNDAATESKVIDNKGVAGSLKIRNAAVRRISRIVVFFDDGTFEEFA